MISLFSVKEIPFLFSSSFCHIFFHDCSANEPIHLSFILFFSSLCDQVYSIIHPISSPHLPSFVFFPVFRNKNAGQRSEASIKQKEKRRKLDKEPPPQKENDPADDAKENDD